MEKHSAAPVRFCHVLITGQPGIGKTTVCKKVLSLIERDGLSCDGFFTEEIRSTNNKRIGFDVVRVNRPDLRSTLARVKQILEPRHKTIHRVGNYDVFVNNFEQIALPVFKTESDVLLIDEIGKMECFSESFTKQINELVFVDGSQNRRCILATIPESNPSHLSLIKKLRSDERSKIFHVRYDNRNVLPNEISNLISSMVKNS